MPTRLFGFKLLPKQMNSKLRAGFEMIIDALCSFHDRLIDGNAEGRSSGCFFQPTMRPVPPLNSVQL